MKINKVTLSVHSITPDKTPVKQLLLTIDLTAYALSIIILKNQAKCKELFACPDQAGEE